MAKHEYHLEFKGYKLDGAEGTLEEASGVYCVYACTYNPAMNSVAIRKLLHIGQAENIRASLLSHAAKPTWKNQLNEGETLCYSRALLNINKEDLAICEAALTFKHQHDDNVQGNDAFHYEETHVTTSGRNAFLMEDFTVGQPA